MNEEQIRKQAAQLMAVLRSAEEDRGAMADLRCAWSKARRSRAWPWLGRAGLIGDPVAETVAGAFGYHPAPGGESNFGNACEELSREHAGAEQRFARLLDADRAGACLLVRPLILALRSFGIPLDHRQLYIDLWLWGDETRARWARAFWVPEAARPEPAEGAEGAGKDAGGAASEPSSEGGA
jgi:hypothetical protein